MQEQPIAPTHEKDLEVDSPSLFGFKKYHPPPLLSLLCRHPPPAIGRDDDVHKLKEVLDDILIKLQHDNPLHKADRILFGPDNKIGTNLFKLTQLGRKIQGISCRISFASPQKIPDYHTLSVLLAMY